MGFGLGAIVGTGSSVGLIVATGASVGMPVGFIVVAESVGPLVGIMVVSTSVGISVVAASVIASVIASVGIIVVVATDGMPEGDMVVMAIVGSMDVAASVIASVAKVEGAPVATSAGDAVAPVTVAAPIKVPLLGATVSTISTSAFVTSSRSGYTQKSLSVIKSPISQPKTGSPASRCLHSSPSWHSSSLSLLLSYIKIENQNQKFRQKKRSQL